jgi:APA family basic amino acid/polyamine antiporter
MQDHDLSAEGLRVGIGFPSAVLLVMGGIVGVGIFVNPAVVAKGLSSPYMALGAWAAGGVIALLGAFVYAELAARMPSTGGEYVYLRDTFGRLTGFLFGWTTLLVVQAGGMAAVTIVFARNLNILAGGALPEPAVVVATLGVLAAVNCLGVKSGNGVQSLLGALKVAAIGALIIAGLWFTPQIGFLPHEAQAAASNDPLKAFGAAMIPVVFSYGGWQTANYVAGEIRDPARNLARALLVGVIAVICLYLLVNIACIRALGIEALGKTLTPVSQVLQIATGPLGAKLASAAIGLSAVAYLSQSMLTGPRVYFAMARDGLFFRKVAEIGENSRAPAMAIVLQAIWTGILALSGSYDRILSYVIAMNFLFFGLSAAALLVQRRREQAAGRVNPAYAAAWRPFAAVGFIIASVIIVGCSFWAYPVDSLVGYGIMALGIPPYLFWSRRASKETASAS